MNSVNYINVVDYVEKKSKLSEYFVLPFYKDNKPLSNGKKWGMTLLAASSMRFRWNEKNPHREEVLNKIIVSEHPPVCSGACGSEKGQCDCKYKIVPLELIHSKIVYEVKSETDTKFKTGDGIITDNNLLVPVVTVADCVPVFLYDNVKNIFAVVHSGWKGTGIIGNAIKLAVEKFGSKKEDICIAIGPHICQDCYCIDKDRKIYFTENFGNCVRKKINGNVKTTSDGKLLEYSLSLTDANLYVIEKSGIPLKNVVVARDCTCCSVFSDGEYVFGSFRRQSAFLPMETSPDEKSKKMCVQAAFIV